MIERASALRERERNRLLRRVDWRFLLPRPRPRQAVCFSGGLLERAVGLISERLVDAGERSRGKCDLVAAVNPDRSTLLRARDLLHPGGSFYSEWYPSAWVTIRGVRKRLSEAGFDEASLYWAWPPPSRGSPLFWVPLGNPGALRFFLANRPRSTSPVEGVRRALSRIAWLAMLRLGLSFPICAVVRKRSQAPDDPTSPTLENSIKDGWQALGLGPVPARFDRLLLTGGHRSINKVVALIFANDGRPAMVVKLPRVREAVPSLERERVVLGSLHAVRGVPRVVFFSEGEASALGETYLGGEPLFTRLRPDNFHDLANAATDWLAQLVAAEDSRPRSRWWDRLAEPILSRFEASFGSVVDPESLKQTRVALGRLDRLPPVHEHRDFSPWNVLITRNNRLVVLDWESAELEGLPALDLIYFLTYLAFFANGAMESGRYRESYRELLDPGTPTGRVFRECQRRYCERLGLDPCVMHPLRLLTWLLHSRSEFGRLAADAGGPPNPEALRSSLFVALWEEELRHGQVS